MSCVSIIIKLAKKKIKINFDTNFFSIDLFLERHDKEQIIEIIRCIIDDFKQKASFLVSLLIYLFFL